MTGASSGIGEAIARSLAARGVPRLVLVARRRDRLDALADALAEAHGTTCEVLVADLADPDDLSTVEARCAAPDDPVDLLVNNAGFGTSGRFVELPVDGEEEEIRVNVVAPMRLSNAVLPGMVARGRGAVMNVSSMGCYSPAPGNATYAATKAFLTSFSEAVFEELRGTGVTMTAVCPGFTRTEFHERVGDSDYNHAPEFVWMPAQAVAEAAVDATAAGKALCVPGVGYKVAAGVISPLPRNARRWLIGRGSRTLR